MKKFSTLVEQEAFDLGAVYIKEYIGFCIANYVYQLNLSGLTHFFHDLFDFIKGAKFIPNTQNNMTFKEFCKQYTFRE